MTKISANVPAAARRQVKAANQLIAELNTKPGEAPVLEPLSPNAAPPREVPNFPSVGAEIPADAAPVKPAPPPSTNAAPPPSELDIERHRNSVLQGKYNAETSRLMGAAQALQDENNRLLRRLEEARANPAPVPRAEDQFDLSAVTPKEREEYGEELIGIMARIAKANSSQEVARLNAEINQLRSSVSQTTQVAHQSAVQGVYKALNDFDPQWEITNVSQEFLDWLELPDMISGVVRKNALTNAFQTANATRVVAIFKAFREDSYRGSAPANTPAQPQVNRNDLIAPGQPRGGSAEAPNGTGGKIWSEQEIEDFYSRVQRKRIPDEERKATEADIHKAMIEGRIQPRANVRGIQNSA